MTSQRERANGGIKVIAVSIILTLACGVLTAGRGGASAYAVASEAGSKAASSEKKPKTAPVDAKSLYLQNCARCHGADGRAGTEMGKLYDATDLTDAQWWKAERINDKRLVTSIANGGDGMPAFSKRLSKDQIAALAQFVKTFKGK